MELAHMSLLYSDKYTLSSVTWLLNVGSCVLGKQSCLWSLCHSVVYYYSLLSGLLCPSNLRSNLVPYSFSRPLPWFPHTYVVFPHHTTAEMSATSTLVKL